MLLLLFQRGDAVEISWAYLGIPEVVSAPDLSASQTVGDFGQSATAEVWAQAQAAQTVGDFTQAATAQVWAQAQASQQVGNFAQTATAEVVALADLSAAQQVGDFGQLATAANDSPQQAQQGATPGYASARSHRYRVRVGRRWVTVDPLDPLSVRSAMEQAREAAEQQAQGDVQDAPQTVAKRVVRVDAPRVSPNAPRVDYAALRADAERVAEQVRAVYAEALQRELISRLMREAMERDEDEAVLLLLG